MQCLFVYNGWLKHKTLFKREKEEEALEEVEKLERGELEVQRRGGG